MRALSKTVTVTLLIFFLFTSPSTAAIKSIRIQSDNRSLIILDQFGFTHTGSISIAISNVSVTSTGSLYDPSLIGFFLLWDRTMNQLVLEHQQNPRRCVVDSIFDSPLFTLRDILELNSSLHKSYDVTYPHEYSLFIANCNVPQLSVTMDVRTELYNVYDGTTKDYLSVGLTRLPSIYFVVSLVYMCFLAIWIRGCLKNKRSVHRIHLVMGALLTTQTLSMFCDAEDRHDVKVTGTSHGWEVMFYMCHSMNSVLLFIVIVLIGSGWSYLKPSLQKKEKIFLVIMTPIQVLGNVAKIAFKEAGLYSKDLVILSQVFLWTDIICCFGVLVPIVWSIRSLKSQRSKTDEKPGRNLSLITKFYRLVIGYLLFTRIWILSWRIIVDYESKWMCSAAQEVGTLVFYLVMFYMFRPVEEVDEDALVKTLSFQV